MVLFALCLAALALSQGVAWMLLSLFGVGVALGCDYPTAHMIISENIPSRNRGRMVLSAFGFLALGALAGTAAGYRIMFENPELSAWRDMYATAIVPAVLVTLGRFTIPDSGLWLVSRGRIRESERETMRLLQRTRPTPAGSRWPSRPPWRPRPNHARRRGQAPTRASLRRSTAAPPSWPPSPGSPRTWEPTASASSPQPSWPPSSGQAP